MTSKKSTFQIEDSDEEDCKECPICCSNYTKLNKQVSCVFCLYTICTSCVKRRSMDTLECMNCKNIWSLEFVQDNTTKVWFNTEYKEKRKNDLLDREKALLQTALPIIKSKALKKRYGEKRENIRKQIGELYALIHHLEIEENFQVNRVLNGYEEETDEKVLDNLNINLPTEDKQKAQFIKPCPVNECRGFLSTRWKCDVCETYVCKDCLAIKKQEDDDHKCNADDIASAEFLKKDTRPCPKCGTRIHRIDGCNAMFCVHCKTCFNFKTGEIQKTNSNPHFHEWKRRGGDKTEFNAQQLVNECQNVDNITRIIKVIRDYSFILSRYDEVPEFLTNRVVLDSFEQFYAHFYEQVLLPYRRDSEISEDTLIAYRVRYLEKTIEDAYWKQTILRMEKKSSFNRSMYQLCQMFLEVLRDIMTRITREIGTTNKTQTDVCLKIAEISKEIEPIIQYFNQQSDKIARRHNYTKREQIYTNYSNDVLRSQNRNGCRGGFTRTSLKPVLYDKEGNKIGIFNMNAPFPKIKRGKKEEQKGDSDNEELSFSD